MSDEIMSNINKVLLKVLYKLKCFEEDLNFIKVFF